MRFLGILRTTIKKRKPQKKKKFVKVGCDMQNRDPAVAPAPPF